MDSGIEQQLEQAAAAISEANALFIGAGAGMGVDSGLPDFRGPSGFWKAYPVFRGKDFSEISNPKWFTADPELAWGFFGHRLNLYRGKQPHAGFQILRRWCERMSRGYFVFTSNVDGHFQRAGFAEDRLVECHGSIGFLQCSICQRVWPAGDLHVEVDLEKIRARQPLPTCPDCRDIVRPNILMFDDFSWLDTRTAAQWQRMQAWLKDVEYDEWMHDGDVKIAVLEFGAGTTIPTVRMTCEARGGQLIRVNPRDTSAPLDAIVLPLGALEAIERIDDLLD